MNKTAVHVDGKHIYSELTSRIIACALDAHKSLGPGFEEVFYQRALHRELTEAGIEATREVEIDVCYKNIVMGKKRVDFIVGDCLVEIKAKSELTEADKIQTLSYLKASKYPIALLLNFGDKEFRIKRIANTKGITEP